MPQFWVCHDNNICICRLSIQSLETVTASAQLLPVFLSLLTLSPLPPPPCFHPCLVNRFGRTTSLFGVQKGLKQLA